MTDAVRRVAAAIVVVLAAAAAHATPAPPPKLVVVIVVDQMRGDYIGRYGFQRTAGLRRLVEEGAWLQRAAYPGVTTVTCVGHATVSTGAFPRSHGIVGNSWFDRGLGRSVACSLDESLTTTSYASPAEDGQGPSGVLLPALSDELRTQLPVPARVVTMSMKERTAIMLAGHRADAVTWFSGATGGFVTSSAYTSAPVPFVTAFTRANPVSADFGKGVRPGQYVRAVTPADIAPTLAYLCGVTLAHADGEVLVEALAPSTPVVQ
jgi:hypothetical protein